MLIASVVTGVTVLTALTGTASAWTYGLTAYGQCISDGYLKITWTVNNMTENEPLGITSSSNPLVVPVGTKIDAHKTADFIQKADGTKPGNYSLTLKGDFPSDHTERVRMASFDLKEACKQPTPPVTGGQGSGPTPTPVVVTPVVAPQVKAPVGPVNAGGGHMAINASALLGLFGSAGLIGVSLRRIYKKGF